MKGEKVASEEKSEESITIFFGAIHTYPHDDNLRYVVLDTGQDDWFVVSQLLPDGQLGIAGTSSYEYIGEVIGTLSLEDILKGLEMTIGSMPKIIEEELRKSSQKPHRDISERGLPFMQSKVF